MRDYIVFNWKIILLSIFISLILLNFLSWNIEKNLETSYFNFNKDIDINKNL